MTKFNRAISSGALVGCAITTAVFALWQKLKKTRVWADEIDVNEMGSCPQPESRHSIADVIAAKERAAENARLERIRNEMYDYGISKLHISPEKAKAAAEMAVRAAAGGRTE